MNDILLTVLSLSLSASLIALPLLLCRPLYKNRLHKTWQYYIWLVVVARLLIPFAPETSLINWAAQAGQSRTARTAALAEDVPDRAQAPAVSAVTEGTVVESVSVVEGGDLIEDVDHIRQGELPAPTASQYGRSLLEELKGSLWMVWFGVALVLLVRKVTSYHSFVRFIRAGRQEVEDPQVLDLYFTACEEQGLRRPMPLYLNKLAVSPMLVGVLRPCLVLPDAGLEPEELELVFRHELVHRRRRDIVYKWLVQIAVCLHWFNPLVYWMSREVDKACELSCDEMVLRKLDSPGRRRYGDTLMAAVRTGGTYGDTVASVTMSEDARLLKERLEAIIQHVRKPRHVVACSMLLAVALFFGAAFTGAYTGAKAVAPLIAEDVGETVQEAVASTSTELAVEEGVESYSFTTTWPSATYDMHTYTSVQNYHFRDGYLFGIRWSRNDSLQKYTASVAIQAGGRELALAFPAETAQYALDDDFIRAAQEKMGEWYLTAGGMEDSTLLVVTDVAGPYTESADQLLERFYREKNLVYFSAVAPEAGEETRERVLRLAFDDNRVEYLSILAAQMREDADLDDLVREAMEKNRISLFAVLLPHASKEVRQELLEQAVERGMTSFVSMLSDELKSLNVDDLARQAFSRGQVSIFSMLSDRLSEEAVLELAEQAFEKGQTSFFSMLADELPDAARAQYAKRALDGGQTGMFSLVMDDLSQKDLEEYARQAFEKGQTGLFSMLLDDLSQEELERYAREAFEKGNTALFSLVADELPRDAQIEYAEKAFARGNTALFSMLADELPRENLADYAWRAYEADQIALFTMVMDELSDAELKLLAERAFADQKFNFQVLLMNYL